VLLIFFSKHSVAKQGYIQREFRLALDTLEEMPSDAIHTIPIRLDGCQIPEQLRPLQWSDLAEEGEFDRIVQALRLGMEQRQTIAPEPALEPPPDPIPDRARTFSASWYENDVDAMAWYSGNSGRKTHEVGQKRPNAWGLYDMLAMCGSGTMMEGGRIPVRV
jgi:hypothetical protein